jgi:hypothetical protein
MLIIPPLNITLPEAQISKDTMCTHIHAMFRVDLGGPRTIKKKISPFVQNKDVRQ